MIIFCVICAFIVRTNSTTNNNSTRARRFVRKKQVHIHSGQLQFVGPKYHDELYELCFGLLLPREKTAESRCSYGEALPAMELAIRKLQQPGGLFEQFNITVEYRDTKSSTTFSSLAAVDIYTKQAPGGIFFFDFFFALINMAASIGGFYIFDSIRSMFIDVIFGPLDDYSLAPVSRFALVWDIPIITPGGLAPAFTITKQVDMISINKFFDGFLDSFSMAFREYSKNLDEIEEFIILFFIFFFLI